VASLSQGRTAAAQCGLFTYKSVPVIFEPPCTNILESLMEYITLRLDSANEVEQWYVRHNYFYFLIT